MKVERDRLIAYMRIIITAVAVGSLFLLPPEFWNTDKKMLIFEGIGASVIYSIVVLFLIGRLDKGLLYYLTLLIDLGFSVLLLLAVRDYHNSFLLVFLYLIFSYGIGRSLFRNLVCATFVSVVFGFLTFFDSATTPNEKMMNLVFVIVMFYLFGLGVSISTKIEIKEDDKEEEQQVAPRKEEQAEPAAAGFSPHKPKGSGVTWQIPKTLEEAYSIIRVLKKERDDWEKKYMEERQKGNTIRQIAHKIATQKEIYSLYEDIVNAVRSEVSSQAGFLMRQDKNRLTVKYYDGSMSEITMKIFETSDIFYKVLNSGNSIRLGVEHQDVLGSSLAACHDKIKSLLCVPLKTQYDKNPFGLIGLANYQGQEGVDYSETHEEFLRLVAIEAAVAIKNIEYLRDIEKKYDELILGLARAIEAKDDYTHEHVDRVRVSEKLARVLGLPEDEVRIIKTAATLHDVGKIATPDQILKKQGALDDAEWQQMKMHTIRSRDILEGISSLEREVLNMVLLHHERYDGKGYPKGLKGDDIPMGSKIIAVADTFDAMTSDRPYRKGFPEDEALNKMKEECRGSQFDPAVLDAFLRMMSKRVISKRVRDRGKRVDFSTADGAPGDVSLRDRLERETPIPGFSRRDSMERESPIPGFSRRDSMERESPTPAPSRRDSMERESPETGGPPPDASRIAPPQQPEKPRRMLEIDFTKKE